MASELHIKTSHVQIIEKAREAEENGDLDEAAIQYEQVIKQYTGDEFSFDRLMIIYRKGKKYKEELRIINKGIRVFEDLYKKPALKRSVKQQKLTTLSNAFIKSAGLKDKKGNLLYMPEPIARWMKRKVVVEKKLT